MRVYGVRAADGVEVWRYQTAGRVRATATVAGDDVIVASDDGFLFSFFSRIAFERVFCRRALEKKQEREHFF